MSWGQTQHRIRSQASGKHREEATAQSTQTTSRNANAYAEKSDGIKEKNCI